MFFFLFLLLLLLLPSVFVVLDFSTFLTENIFSQPEQAKWKYWKAENRCTSVCTWCVCMRGCACLCVSVWGHSWQQAEAATPTSATPKNTSYQALILKKHLNIFKVSLKFSNTFPKLFYGFLLSVRYSFFLISVIAHRSVHADASRHTAPTLQNFENSKTPEMLKNSENEEEQEK